MTTNHSDFVDILSHDRPRSCRPSAINIKEPISKLTWRAIAMALWNSGTMEQKWPRSNTVLKKRNERTLRWRDPATYLGTPDRPGRSCWPLMKSFISSGCTSEKLGKSCAEAASISSFLWPETKIFGRKNRSKMPGWKVGVDRFL